MVCFLTLVMHFIITTLFDLFSVIIDPDFPSALPEELKKKKVVIPGYKIATDDGILYSTLKRKLLAGAMSLFTGFRN